MTDRAQAFTFEAVAAALLLVGTVAFITQAPGVTPLTASAASQEVTSQHRGVAMGVLDTAAEQDVIRPTLLYWNNSTERFHGADEDDNYYIDGGPPTAFGNLLNQTFDDRDTAFNVEIAYVTGGQIERIPLVRQGTPTSEAIRASRTVTLYDDDVLLNASEGSSGITLNSTPAFYAPDAGSSSSVYNVVHVEVVIWRV